MLETSLFLANGERDTDRPTKIKILLVDDQTVMRIGLRQTLGMQEGYNVVGEAAAGAKALKQIETLKPNLVLMEVDLPDASGIEISRCILDSHPDIKIVIYSSNVSRSTIDKALKIGVCGYLSKGSSLDELLRAIQAVLLGKLYLSVDASGEILKDYCKSLREKSKRNTSAISEQDKDLLRLISKGLRNKEIASELHVTGKSVEACRSRLMKSFSVPVPRNWFFMPFGKASHGPSGIRFLSDSGASCTWTQKSLECLRNLMSDFGKNVRSWLIDACVDST